MKIFSWVHRRFNNKAENVKKNGENNNVCEEEEKRYFPGEEKCGDVLERWRGGILTIGTLGYDPFKDQQNLNNAYFSDDDDDGDSEKDGDDDEEDDPLVFSTYSFNGEEQQSMAMGFTGIEMEDEKWSHKLGFEYVMMKKKERITLADLFCVDSHNNIHDTNTNTNTKKQTAFNKSDLVKDKSNRKQGTKDARPIHKLNRLMRRMLKRKIHPDVGPTNPKCRCISTTDDYTSLLPTQDADHI